MSPTDQIIDTIADFHGLARVPLFGSGVVPGLGHHEVLLDGKDGSFAISVSDRAGDWDPRSWAWSANVPHHISIVGDRVSVSRWDTPEAVMQLHRRDLIDFPEFYASLRHDRVRESRTIVNHSVNLFRSVRGILHHAGVPDDRTIDVYLALLAQLSPARSASSSKGLSSDAKTLLKSLPSNQIERALSDFSSVQLRHHTVNAWTSLAIRHASGAIFEEAHNAFVTTGPDLFGYVTPVATIALKQSDVHFTPPAIARSIAEQAIHGIADLMSRKSLIVADYACGSGAFLIEAIRALQRFGYNGRLVVVGVDSSEIAVKTARFAINHALAEWTGKSEFRIEVGDGLESPAGVGPKPDLIVMNPPFRAWQDLSAERRVLVEGILGERSGRPDLSMAFISCALERLSKGGVLATLLPASLLTANSSRGWRNRLTEKAAIILQATFDDHSIFANATVRPGALVLAPSSLKHECIELRAGGTPDASGDALRALRRLTVRGSVGDIEGEDWIIRKGSSRSQSVKMSGVGRASTVGDAFRLMQGIRTGCNPAFVLSEGDLQVLPRGERAFFRSAITSQGIKNGRVESVVFVFYPYDSDGNEVFLTERQLKDRLPTYYSKFLLHHKLELKSRPRVTKWWTLSEKRPGLKNSNVLFASKYFASAGGIALNAKTGTSLILQGFGWVPQRQLSELVSSYGDARPNEITLAYLAVLNSEAFFSRIARYSPPVRGGQRDMSPRFLANVPLPLLTDVLQKSEIGDLAHYASVRYLSSRSAKLGLLSVDAAEGLIGQRVFGDRPRIHLPIAEGLPAWANEIVKAGLEDPGNAARVNLLVHMQRIARSHDLSEVDAVLERIDVRSLSQMSLITFLRGTFSFSGRLRSWKGFRDRVGQEFDRRGMDRNKILTGLLG
ncbi:MAG TPA: N-6 DNA methylase [Pseudolabrys sp.]|nr:N-6 DNA methylase [Pseudolabrys sp.]